MEKGNFRCNFIYYDLFLTLLDMEKDYIKLIDLSEVLVSDIIMGNVFSIFDLFFKRKILIKHFKLPEEKLNNEYLHDLLEITKNCLYNKEMILRSFSGTIVFTELLLSHGFLNYCGAYGEKDYKLAEDCLKKSFKTSNNLSYKRFCYSYIFKIRMKCLGLEINKKHENLKYLNNTNELEEKINKENFEEKKISENLNETEKFLKLEDLKDNKGNEIITQEKLGNKLLNYEKLIVASEKINKTKNKLFKIYNDSLTNGKIEDFSSSYFYFMGKINENGWGCKKDDIYVYCYYHHGENAKIQSLGTGSIISYYRKYKSTKKLIQNKYLELLNSLNDLKKKISLEQDEKVCYICYENEKNIMLLPCKHMICDRCYHFLKETSKCPSCRTKILMVR